MSSSRRVCADSCSSVSLASAVRASASSAASTSCALRSVADFSARASAASARASAADAREVACSSWVCSAASSARRRLVSVRTGERRGASRVGLRCSGTAGADGAADGVADGARADGVPLKGAALAAIDPGVAPTRAADPGVPVARAGPTAAPRAVRGVPSASRPGVCSRDGVTAVGRAVRVGVAPCCASLAGSMRCARCSTLGDAPAGLRSAPIRALRAAVGLSDGALIPVRPAATVRARASGASATRAVRGCVRGALAGAASGAISSCDGRTNTPYRSWV